MPQPRTERYFIAMALILLVIIVSGFALEVSRRPGGTGSLSPLLVVHGATFLCWYLVLLVQPALIAGGHRQAHRVLGWLSLVLVIAIPLMAFQVVAAAYHRPGWTIGGLPPEGSALFALADIVNFMACAGLAFAFRRRVEAHKRLMLLTGFAMLDPGASRLLFGIGLPPLLVIGCQAALLASLPLRDLRVRQRVHWASTFGLAMFGLGLVMKFQIANSEEWAVIARALFA